MLAFLWTMTYLMARAIRREAEVARLQSDFVAAVSHEFRSPLTTVRQMAEMLERDRSADRARQHDVLPGTGGRSDAAAAAGRNAAELRPDGSRCRAISICPGRRCRHWCGPWSAIPNRRRGRPASRLKCAATTAAVRVLADEDALALAVRNLIDNAIKYSPDQPTVWVRVEDRAGIARRSRSSTAARAFARVRTGSDVPEVRARPRRDRRRNVKGTGVGLAMVQQIVAAHGGEVRLESELGRGQHIHRAACRWRQ